MCSNVRGAASPTHATIEATLQVDANSQLGIAAPTTLITQITSIPRPTTTGIVTTNLANPTDSAASSKRPEEEGASATKEKQSSKLNKAQVAGVSIGLIAAVGLAFGAIFLARHLRRKKYPDTETGFFVQKQKLKALSMRISRRLSRFRGGDISGPLHGTAPAMTMNGVPPPKQFPMGSYAPTDWRPDSIGMALTHSTQRVGAAPPRKSPPPPMPTLPLRAAAAKINRRVKPSQSSPGRTSPGRKPVLSLTIPSAASSPTPHMALPNAPQPAMLANLPPPPPRPFRPGSNNTTTTDGTTRTEFEEDGERDYNASQIWRPPPATPQSASAVYVADKYGNWVLADERQRKRISVVELEGTTPNTKTAAEKSNADAALAAATATLKAKKVTNTPASLAPPADIPRNAELRRYDSVASSVYSQDSDATPWISDAPPMPTMNMNDYTMVPPPLAPRKADSTVSNAPRFPRAKKPVYSPVLNPFLDDSRLSPVVESPSSRGSKRTPPMNQRGMRMTPSPVVNEPVSPPGQPSPTLGLATLATTPQRRPAATPSPPTRPSKGGNLGLPRGPSPQDGGISPVSPAAHKLPHIAYLSTHPPDRYPSSNLLTGGQQSPSQSATSLLAKRLGTDRAAGMAIDSSAPSSSSRRPNQWQRQMSPRTQRQADLARERFQQQEEEFQKQQQRQQNLKLNTNVEGGSRASQATAGTAWTAESASTWDSNVGFWNGPGAGTGVGLGFVNRKGEKNELPSTPTWKPKLTPARRGDDLYLNVQ